MALIECGCMLMTWLDNQSWNHKKKKHKSSMLSAWYVTPLGGIQQLCGQNFTQFWPSTQENQLDFPNLLPPHQKRIVNYYLRQKFRQRISVMKTKHRYFCCLQDKLWIRLPNLWKHRVRLFPLLRFFDKLFNVIIDHSFLTL